MTSHEDLKLLPSIPQGTRVTTRRGVMMFPCLRSFSRVTPDVAGTAGAASGRPCGRFFTRFRLTMFATSLLSILLVLTVQCLFTDISPLIRSCCSGQVASKPLFAYHHGDIALTTSTLRSGREQGLEKVIQEEEHEEHEERENVTEGEGDEDSAEVAQDSGQTEEFNQFQNHSPKRHSGHRRFRWRDDSSRDVTDDPSIKQRLPQCLIIGIRKAGTRALLEFLRLHPSVVAHRSETHFFNEDHNYALGLEWYRTSMPASRPDQVTLEKTPGYFADETVPERVYAMNQSIKLLVIVRDPVERAISDYDQIRESWQENGKMSVSFEDLAIRRDDGRVNEGYVAVRRSVYHRYMARWLQLFPLEQFHFVSGEALVRNPLAELRKVETFLGLPRNLTEEQFYLNRTRGFYCMRVGKGQVERCLSESKGRQHSAVAPEVIQKLRRYFIPHNEKFYNMIGIDFGWPS